jgi:hypothetical protein
VDARIRTLRWSDWSRPPVPVADLRFDIKSTRSGRNSVFKVYDLEYLRKILDILAAATPDSWLEVRSFRGDIRRVGAGFHRVDCTRLAVHRSFPRSNDLCVAVNVHGLDSYRRAELGAKLA